MINKLKENLSGLKIRTQFLLLILCTVLTTIGLFQFLWLNKWNVWDLGLQTGILKSLELKETFFQNLYDDALKYNVPGNENDVEGKTAIQPFLDIADDYTGIYIYGLEDGTYRAGKVPQFISNDSRHMLFNIIYQFTNGSGEQHYEFPLKFKNGYATVMITFYHQTRFVFPYYAFCITVSGIFFLCVLSFFIQKKMNSIILLEKAILQMASGDLNTPLPKLRMDEIGILAKELNSLRRSLQETINREAESRRANQDLITALSHDLRTPLTILKGYLEVTRLNRNPDKCDEYLTRCITKADEIQEMTDRMFEYALVYEESESPHFQTISSGFLTQCLRENIDFIKLTGFHTTLSVPEENTVVQLDPAMVKRIFNNLFSNIIKYGNKKEPINIIGSISDSSWSLTLKNSVKPDCKHIESNQIGLKSTQKMIEAMQGSLSISQTEQQFAVTLSFPLIS